MRMRKIMQGLVMVLALTLISPLETVSSAASETVSAAETGGENHTDPGISDTKDSDRENTDTESQFTQIFKTIFENTLCDRTCPFAKS